jgi:membrane-bound lytic murein transglycosylase MltF
MREEQFYNFLITDENIKSKVKAVSSRMSRARNVEKSLNINLDVVVKDDDTMYNTLLTLKEDFKDNGKLQNAVRKYYVFINHKEFPSMVKYKRISKFKHQ